jgi:hypothetical protein
MEQEILEQHSAACNETRKKIPDGPWQSEPDRMEFKHAGLDCLLSRNTRMFHWCGYAGVPKGLGLKKLKTTKQCVKCPWKVSTNPYEIPNGYCKKKHEALLGTIAGPPEVTDFFGDISAMACHESKPGEENHCIGWLMNQLGDGKNIPLRIAMRDYDLSKVKLDGEQHSCFQDTLPKDSL